MDPPPTAQRCNGLYPETGLQTEHPRSRSAVCSCPLSVRASLVYRKISSYSYSIIVRCRLQYIPGSQVGVLLTPSPHFHSKPCVVLPLLVDVQRLTVYYYYTAVPCNTPCPIAVEEPDRRGAVLLASRNPSQSSCRFPIIKCFCTHRKTLNARTNVLARAHFHVSLGRWIERGDELAHATVSVSRFPLISSTTLFTTSSDTQNAESRTSIASSTRTPLPELRKMQAL